ncbi:protein required for normal CLN1 and CLN2 G1 cyclin expression [Dimargaris verticillata]|uniref:Protein required for normal CLN1 and CLN2 G1 cyclin expression n=1 Tax=Dimargaris verticillata TaxID=2761393 RepID=A0A9W8EBK8_9FUNG|nr:protein required for normal CLN1 and CLN2 G1 cyclin expression [Dimargaris verticillata]
MADTIIELPLQGSDNVLEIDCSQLPEQSNELCDILIQEEAPLKFYLQLAVEYYRQHQADEAISMLKMGLANVKVPDPIEKVPLINCLAAIYLQKARRARHNPLQVAAVGSATTAADDAAASERDQYLELATALFNEADRIDSQQPLTWLGKGTLYWLRRQSDLALDQFRGALEQDPHNIAAKFGVARIQFHSKKYREALASYQELLRYRPAHVPDPRLGIGLCFYKLGMIKEAKHAFERAIQVNPQELSARVLLAIMYFNEFKTQLVKSGQPNTPILEIGMDYLKSAVTLNQRHPVVSDLLADYFFTRQDPANSLAFACSGIINADTPAIEAESHYQAARNYHRLEDYERAFDHYQRAVKLNATHHLARFGLGQVLLHRQKLPEALALFEQFVEMHPTCIEAWNMLGAIHARLPSHQAQALQAFDRVLQLVATDSANEALANDPGLFIDMGKTYEQTNLAQALKAYEKAIALYSQHPPDTESTSRVPVELYNNVGALHHALHNYDTAATFYEKAQPSSTAEKTPMAYTVMYNLARLREYQRRPGEAQELYRQIMAAHPAYLDAYLRLGVIAQESGQAPNAEGWYLDAQDIDGQAVLPQVLTGLLQVDRKQLRPARHTLERVLKDCDRHELYSLVAIGNIYLKTARNEPQKELRIKLYQRAIEFFDTVLGRDSKNLYAAQGVGIALAERGAYSDAGVIFNHVREACGDALPMVTLNLGHVAMEQGLYRNAIYLYETCLRKASQFTPSNRVFQQVFSKELFMSLSRAHYVMGKTDKNPQSMRHALTQAQKASALDPTDLATLYDIALIEQTFAQLVSEKSADFRSTSDVRKAIAHLEHSKRLFEFLVKQPSAPAANGTSTGAKPGPFAALPYDKKLTEQRVNFSESLLSKLKKHLEEQQKLETARESTIEATRRKREEDRLRRQAEEVEREQAQAEERRLVEEERQRLQEKVRQEMQELSQTAAADSDDDAKRKSKGKKKSRPRNREHVGNEDEDGFASGGDNDHHDDDAAGGEAIPKRKRTAKPRLRRRKVLQEGGDLVSGGGLEDEGDDEQSATNGEEHTPRKKYKSKAFVESDDDSS